MPKHRSGRGYPHNRSVVAPTGVSKYQQECRSTNRTSTHSFFGPRYSCDYMSFRTYNLSLSHSVFMTFFFSCSCSCSDFSSFSCFINISISIAFPIFSYKNTYTCTCPYHRHLLIQCDAYVFTHHSCILVPL